MKKLFFWVAIVITLFVSGYFVSAQTTTEITPTTTPVATSDSSANYPLLEPLTLKDGTVISSFNTEAGQEGQGLSGMINFIFEIAIGIAGVLGVVMLTVFGFQYAANDKNINTFAELRKKILNVVFGLMLLLGIFIILRTINPDLLIVEPEINQLYLKAEVESDADPGPDVNYKGVYTPITGLTAAPGNDKVSSKGYVRMPNAPAGEYVFWGATPPAQRCGRPELVNLIYTVATEWGKKHPEEKLYIGDMNTRGHISHRTGVDVDIFTARSTSNFNKPGSFVSNENKAVELGKMFADKKIVKEIYYNVVPVQLAVNPYAKQIGASSFSVHGKNAFMYTQPKHYNHFHVRILDKYKGPKSERCEGI